MPQKWGILNLKLILYFILLTILLGFDSRIDSEEKIQNWWKNRNLNQKGIRFDTGLSITNLTRSRQGEETGRGCTRRQRIVSSMLKNGFWNKIGSKEKKYLKYLFVLRRIVSRAKEQRPLNRLRIVIQLENELFCNLIIVIDAASGLGGKMSLRWEIMKDWLETSTRRTKSYLPWYRSALKWEHSGNRLCNLMQDMRVLEPPPYLNSIDNGVG